MAITRVQSAVANSAAVAVNTLDVVFGAAPTDGNVIIVAASGVSALQIVSTAGITWMGNNGLGASSTAAMLAIGRVFSGASATITVSSGSAVAGGIAIVAAEYTGINMRYDRAAFATATSSTPATGASSTTSIADELWAAVIGHRAISGVDFTSPTNSFAIVDQTKTSLGTTGDRSAALLERIVTSVGTANAGATASSSGVWVALLRTLSETPTGGGQRSYSYG